MMNIQSNQATFTVFHESVASAINNFYEVVNHVGICHHFIQVQGMMMMTMMMKHVFLYN